MPIYKDPSIGVPGHVLRAATLEDLGRLSGGQQAAAGQVFEDTFQGAARPCTADELSLIGNASSASLNELVLIHQFQ
ncbi:UNVERIFIED_ORG: hypothetical protein ABIB52_002506 [Arthrobacter sp. UYCu721]